MLPRTADSSGPRPHARRYVLPECGLVVERGSILRGVKRTVGRGSDSFWGGRLSLTKTLYPLFNGSHS